MENFVKKNRQNIHETRTPKYTPEPIRPNFSQTEKVCEKGFLEAPLVREADGEHENSDKKNK